MSEFPCLEVLGVSPQAPGLVVGQRVQLVSGLTMGPLSSGLRVVHATRDQLRVELREGRWWLFDLGAEPRTQHNARAVYDAELSHGDVISALGVTLVFWRHDPGDDVHTALEADVFAHPDDESRWNVWADWLLERDLELGHRITGQRTDDESHARFLGALATEWSLGRLVIDWRRGFPRKAVVREPDPHARWVSPAGVVARVLTHPGMRLLTHLELDLGSFGSGRRLTTEVGAVLEVLGKTPGPPWLESLRLGPFSTPLDVVTARWPEVRRAHPRLVTPEERALILSTHASAHVRAAPVGVRVRPGVGGSVGLAPHAQNVVGQLEEAAVQLWPPDGHALSVVALNLEAPEGRWVVMQLGEAPAGAVLIVNGRARTSAQLRGGDVISIAGLELEFRLR